MTKAPLIVLRTLYNHCLQSGFKHEHMIIAEELLNGNDKKNKDPFYSCSIKDIKLEVYRYLGLKEWEVEMRKRKRELVTARQVAMAMCMEEDIKLISWTTARIADEVGGMDHSTVFHAIKAVRNHCETEPNFKKQYYKLKEYIKYRFDIKTFQETPEL